MDDRFSFLRPDITVIDLGCFSGGWSQVAVERTYASSSTSRVIGVDRIRMDPLKDHTFIQGDVMQEETLRKLVADLGSRKADVFLSDLAPKAVGLRNEDAANSAECCLAAANLMEKCLRLGGWFIVKMLSGEDTENYRRYLDTRFDMVRTIRPHASKSDLGEVFFVCRGFVARTAIAEEVQTSGTFSSKHEGIDRWAVGTKKSYS